ncbi:MAG: twin-arginine translocase TatA/TatE family subunit [Candidatus Cryptobacteroides sp.]
MMLPLIFNLGIWEIVIIALVILLLLGGKKLPELMKGVGEGIRNFKSGLKDGNDEKDTSKESDKEA